MRSLRVVLGAFAATVAACSLAAAVTGARTPDSGVSGLVRGAPSSGRDARATIVARDRATGHVVAQTHVSRAGRFRLRLEPGRYLLDASTTGAKAHARRAVRVRAHRFELVVLRLDSPQRGSGQREREPVGGRAGVAAIAAVASLSRRPARRGADRAIGWRSVWGGQA